LDYNNLWNGNQDELVRWGSADYTTLAAFTTATGQEPHGLNANPGFVNPQNGEYTLNQPSTLIDAGVIIPGINDDYVGFAPDMGAFESEYVSSLRVRLPIAFRP
jgi:hypothetical protein